MFRKYSNKKCNDFSLSIKMYNIINKIRENKVQNKIENKIENKVQNNVENKVQNNIQNIRENTDLLIYPTFNILIATIGRNSLEILIESLCDQLKENDCITIIFDNNKIRKIKNIKKLKCKVVIINEIKKLGYWGHGIRNKYASLLQKKDFILHADDDDTYFPGAFDKLRKLCIDKDVIYIARIIIKEKLLPDPKIKTISIGNISTQCGIIPYKYNNKSKWGDFYGGDARFYLGLVKVSIIKFIDACIYNYGNKIGNLRVFEKIEEGYQPFIVSE